MDVDGEFELRVRRTLMAYRVKRTIMGEIVTCSVLGVNVMIVSVWIIIDISLSVFTAITCFEPEERVITGILSIFTRMHSFYLVYQLIYLEDRKRRMVWTYYDIV